MKKLILLCCALPCILFIACHHHHGDISIHYNDDNDSYSMDAWFQQSKTRTAERYMNDMIGRENNISFFHARGENVFAMEDGSKFYMKKSPGHILIRMNKEETSYKAYHDMKEMCMGIKDVVVK